MKNFGLTLNEISGLLDMIEMNEATCHNVNDLVDGKIDLLDNKIRDLIAFRDQLIAGLQRCKNRCIPVKADDNCPILVSDDF